MKMDQTKAFGAGALVLALLVASPALAAFEVVVEGKVEDVVVEVKDLEDKPVLVSYRQLSPDGDSYILSMTEAEIQTAPAHRDGKGAAAGQGQSRRLTTAGPAEKPIATPR